MLGWNKIAILSRLSSSGVRIRGERVKIGWSLFGEENIVAGLPDVTGAGESKAAAGPESCVGQGKRVDSPGSDCTFPKAR